MSRRTARVRGRVREQFYLIVKGLFFLGACKLCKPQGRSPHEDMHYTLQARARGPQTPPGLQHSTALDPGGLLVLCTRSLVSEQSKWAWQEQSKFTKYGNSTFPYHFP